MKRRTATEGKTAAGGTSPYAAKLQRRNQAIDNTAGRALSKAMGAVPMKVAMTFARAHHLDGATISERARAEGIHADDLLRQEYARGTSFPVRLKSISAPALKKGAENAGAPILEALDLLIETHSDGTISILDSGCFGAHEPRESVYSNGAREGTTPGVLNVIRLCKSGKYGEFILPRELNLGYALDVSRATHVLPPVRTINRSAQRSLMAFDPRFSMEGEAPVVATGITFRGFQTQHPYMMEDDLGMLIDALRQQLEDEGLDDVTIATHMAAAIVNLRAISENRLRVSGERRRDCVRPFLRKMGATFVFEDIAPLIVDDMDIPADFFLAPDIRAVVVLPRDEAQDDCIPADEQIQQLQEWGDKLIACIKAGQLDGDLDMEFSVYSVERVTELVMEGKVAVAMTPALGAGVNALKIFLKKSSLPTSAAMKEALTKAVQYVTHALQNEAQEEEDRRMADEKAKLAAAMPASVTAEMIAAAGEMAAAAEHMVIAVTATAQQPEPEWLSELTTEQRGEYNGLLAEGKLGYKEARECGYNHEQAMELSGAVTGQPDADVEEPSPEDTSEAPVSVNPATELAPA